MKKRRTLGIGGVPGCIFCVGRFGWPSGCSGVGSGFGTEGASSGSAGLVAVWLFCVIKMEWTGIWSRLLGIEFSAW